MDPRSVLLPHRAVFLRGFYLHMGGGDAPAMSLLGKIPFSMSLELHSAESAAQSAPLLLGACPAPFSLRAWRCHPGPTRAAQALLSLSFQQENALLMWVEAEWVVLRGWLGNTAFM